CPPSPSVRHPLRECEKNHSQTASLRSRLTSIKQLQSRERERAGIFHRPLRSRFFGINGKGAVHPPACHVANKKRKWVMALVGIARLAAQSDLLEAKRAVQYLEIPARSILNRVKPEMPFQWAINPYRGCEFGCKYCYARYTHEFMELTAEEFEDKIYAKAA